MLSEDFSQIMAHFLENIKNGVLISVNMNIVWNQWMSKTIFEKSFCKIDLRIEQKEPKICFLNFHSLFLSLQDGWVKID